MFSFLTKMEGKHIKVVVACKPEAKNVSIFFLSFFFFKDLFIYLFLNLFICFYFWLCSVSVAAHGLSLVAASGG